MAKGFKQSTLCWDCRMSTIGGCSWSRRFEPVEGWTAERSDLYIDRNHSVVSYCVQRCPKFVRDGLNFGQQRLNGVKRTLNDSE